MCRIGYFLSMLDKTITSALLNLRAQIIRDKLQGLDHVEALLEARGVDPAARHVSRMQPADRLKRSAMRLLVLDSLRGDPVLSKVIVDRLVQDVPSLSREDAMHRLHNALWKMREQDLWCGMAGCGGWPIEG